MSVHAYLVTTRNDSHRLDLWQLTGWTANWLEGRDGKHGQTWQVMVPGEYAAQFRAAVADLNAAGRDITLEEIHGAADHETYELLAGQPDSGWAAASD